MKQISTTALSKALGMPPKDLFSQLQGQGLIIKDAEIWALTPEGELKGGAYRESKQYGRYIVWPEDLDLGEVAKPEPAAGAQKLVTATAIGRHFELSANKSNFILSELGWLKKGLKGWVATEQGLKQGAVQAEDHRSGIPYVRWPESILESKSLKETVAQVKGISHEDTLEAVSAETPASKGFRDKFPAKHRSADGHFVRSKAEMLIDNWLYMAEIVHAYERKLPIEEDVYSDFYIPTGKVYIEYWGYENDPKYLARKEKKIEIYKKYGFNLIELQDQEVQNLDDVLPKLLLKFGVQAY